jgi:hypothetical protein
MYIMHGMTPNASQARSTPAPGPSAPVRPDTRRPGASLSGARLPAQLEAMRRGGMSSTAIRRALGLSAGQALAAGVIAPPRRSRAGAQHESHAGVGAGSRPARRGLAMAAILAAVAEAAGVAPERLRGRAQDHALARTRHLAMLLLRERCAGASLPAIGDFLGRDHSTVIYGCRRAAERLAGDTDYRELRARALELLNGRPSAPVQDQDLVHDQS